MRLDSSDREGIEQLREALRTASYDAAHMRPMLRANTDTLTPRPGDIPIIVRLLPKGDRLSSLIRLFVVGLSLSEADARAARTDPFQVLAGGTLRRRPAASAARPLLSSPP